MQVPPLTIGANRSVCNPAEGGEAASPDEVVRLTELVLAYSVRTSSPLFFNQLYGRVDPVALAAENIISTLNTNAFTWEVQCPQAPPASPPDPSHYPEHSTSVRCNLRMRPIESRLC